jgi:FkbM family methyltransferase
MAVPLPARIVDSSLPALGRFYRQLRAQRAASHPVRTSHGFMLAGPAAMLHPEWEVNEIATFLRCLDRSTACVDVGANVGFYTCLAASRGKKVVAFEPLDNNLIFLYRNLEYNSISDIEIYPVGLSDRPGISRIYGKADVASFVRGWYNEERYYTLVPTLPMDAVVGKRFAGKQLTIKIDVEGFELSVMQGASETLALNPKPFWIVESFLFDPVTTMRLEKNFTNLFELFWTAGYKAQSIGPELRLVEPSDVIRWTKSASPQDIEASNFLFSPA